MYLFMKASRVVLRGVKVTRGTVLRITLLGIVWETKYSKIFFSIR